MLITRIEPGKNKKYKVFGDDTYLFSLYNKELKYYHIEENIILDDSIISSILDEIIYKRAKERALYLLERKPFTTAMLQDKLKNHDYPESVISRVIQFLEHYHYLDDEEYIRMYATAYIRKKSKKQVVYDLIHKGICKDLIYTFFEENEYLEQTGFEMQFNKYIRGKDTNNPMDRQKIFRYFYGKGYEASLIEDALRSRAEYDGY